jgi:hypothetical protein
VVFAALLLATATTTASAQQTTGTITGRVLDDQKAGFNLFNAINPNNFERSVSGVVQTVRLVGGAPNPNYMQPARFAGDFQQPEQRVGQIGFRFTF